MENLRKKAIKIYEAIFGNEEKIEIDGITHYLERTSQSKLRLFKIDGYSFLEQNPHTRSRWAKMAQEGHLIIWVMKGRRYLAQVRDGVFYDFRKKK
jgi:hypothetical protein